MIAFVVILLKPCSFTPLISDIKNVGLISNEKISSSKLTGISLPILSNILTKPAPNLTLNLLFSLIFIPV